MGNNEFMNMKKLLLILLPFIPIILLAQGERINEDWLKKDKSNFINLMEILLSENKEINFFQQELNNLGVRANQDIGFNAKKYEFAQGGGYISNWIKICTLKDSIFYCKVSITSDDVEKMEILAQRDSSILKLLSQNWNRKSFKQNGGLFESFDYEYINQDLYTRFKENVENDFGKIENVQDDSMAHMDYQTLVSPFENYDFGYACYYAGTQPKGRVAIEKIKASNPNLVRSIIKGYSPEGRIYAIEALLELVENGKLTLTIDDKEIIRKVLNLEIPINRCQGCIVSAILARELFKEEKFNRILDKYDIKIE